MKKLLYLISFGVLAIMFSCGSTSNNKFEKRIPFNIHNAFYTNWFGEQPGVKGYIVYLEIDDSNSVLDSIYFRNMSAKLEKDPAIGKNTYLGTFTMPNRMKNYMLHSDSKKEFGNQLPDISKSIPFNLTENEAVILYLSENKIKYYKISEIVERKF